MSGSSRWLGLMGAGEAVLLGELAALPDEGFAEPSALPRWTRAHVLGHLARNADALGNLFTWARTGIEARMYPSREARATGIEESAAQPPAVLRADVEAASARLVATAEALPAGAWNAEVRTALDRPIAATEIPWMRIRETWVHTVDLATGRSFADLPAEVVDGLIDEVARGLAGRVDCPPVVVRSDDGGEWRLGPATVGVEVVGTRPGILAWLIGRDTADAPPTGRDGELPLLPAWL